MNNTSANSAEFNINIRHSAWYRSLSKYEQSNTGIAIGQILDTFVPYFVLWFLMIRMLHAGVSYWLMLPLAVVAAGLLVRIFIIFHDCCHGSFFSSRQ